jgi:hypothetical protein
MVPVYNTDDPSSFTTENLITTEIEAEIHKAIQLWIKQYLTPEVLNEAVIDGYIEGAEIIKVDDFDDLSDYGDLKITFLDNTPDDKQPETLVEIKRLVPEDEEVIEVIEETSDIVEIEETIPTMQEEDENGEEGNHNSSDDVTEEDSDEVP